MLKNKARFLLAIVFGVTLTACNDAFTDLQQYMASVKARPANPVKPLPEFKTVEPFVFKGEEHFRDPFKPLEKIIQPENPDDLEPDNGIHPDVNRVKEPLEAFALSGLRMVGTIYIKSTLWALIKGDGNTIYRVKKGDHLGTNDGKIVQIDKKKIELVEIVPTSPKRFIEQAATLTLTE